MGEFRLLCEGKREIEKKTYIAILSTDVYFWFLGELYINQLNIEI